MRYTLFGSKDPQKDIFYQLCIPCNWDNDIPRVQCHPHHLDH